MCASMSLVCTMQILPFNVIQKLGIDINAAEYLSHCISTLYHDLRQCTLLDNSNGTSSLRHIELQTSGSTPSHASANTSRVVTLSGKPPTIKPLQQTSVKADQVMTTMYKKINTAKTWRSAQNLCTNLKQEINSASAVWAVPRVTAEASHDLQKAVRAVQLGPNFSEQREEEYVWLLTRYRWHPIQGSASRTCQNMPLVVVPSSSSSLQICVQQ